MKNLAKAVISVMKAVDNVEKGMTVGKGQNSYKGLSDKDVKQTFKKALSDNGLCVLPIGIEKETTISRWDALDYSGKPTQKQSVFTEVTSRYLLLHESGESQEIMGLGQGIDPQDKGAGKATTYALKNALMYTFLTPSGKIDDSDTTHSNDIPTKPRAKVDLTPKSPQWEKAVAHIKEKGEATIDKTVIPTYNLTAANRKLLIAATKK